MMTFSPKSNLKTPANNLIKNTKTSQTYLVKIYNLSFSSLPLI